jgi:hypothetical protein
MQICVALEEIIPVKYQGLFSAGAAASFIIAIRL